MQLSPLEKGWEWPSWRRKNVIGFGDLGHSPVSTKWQPALAPLHWNLAHIYVKKVSHLPVPSIKGSLRNIMFILILPWPSKTKGTITMEEPSQCIKRRFFRSCTDTWDRNEGGSAECSALFHICQNHWPSLTVWSLCPAWIILPDFALTVTFSRRPIALPATLHIDFYVLESQVLAGLKVTSRGS
jgi:hypothetical protein